MHLCSLSITYACPYHNPNATMGHSIHNVDISKPLTHMMPYTVSAIFALYSENRASSVKRTSLQSARRHRMCAYDEHADELCAEIIWLCKPIVAAAVWVAGLRGLGSEDAGCGGPGLVWLHVVCGCEAGWMYCQILWNAFGDGLW